MKKDVEKWVEEIQTGLKLSVAHYEQKLLEPESSSGGNDKNSITF